MMKHLLKKHAMALVALAIATTSATLMSFGKNEVKSETMVTAIQTPMYWYSQQGTNNWVLENGSPSITPPENVTCREDEGDHCLKGFSTTQDASAITDETSASVEFYRE